MLAGAAAQDQRVSTTLVGELRSGSATLWGLTVQLEPVIGGSFVVRADVRPDGVFEFRDLAAGTYQASVLDYRGVVVWRDLAPFMPDCQASAEACI